jgi:hypothetical protein
LAGVFWAGGDEASKFRVKQMKMQQGLDSQRAFDVPATRSRA